MTKETIIKALIYLLGAIGVALGIMFGLSSCNVTRTVTTTSQYFQRGDTTMTIQTKTIESYDATKKPNF